MPYTTHQEMTRLFGNAMLIDLTDRQEQATGVVDWDIVDQAIADADALIDGSLKPRYILPLAETPALIAALSRQITIYKLHLHAPSEKIDQDYKDALSALEDIREGRVQLDLEGVTPAQTDAGGAQLTDRDRDMTADKLSAFI